ncbi:MAG: ABC transporter substrate-binding protein [Bacteroidota bacterium]
MLHRILFLVVCTALSITGCTSKKSEGTISRPEVIVAVEGDVDSFNPLFAQEIAAGEINDLLFPGLLGSSFDKATGTLTYTPLLARSWEYANENRDVIFHLVAGAQWADGTPITAHDVKLSFELYGDPDVASVRQGAVAELKLTNGKPDISKSIEILNDSTVVFHFERNYPGQLFDAGLPILPAHILQSIPRKDLSTHDVNRSPLASGPFLLARWTPMQDIVLVPNKQSLLPYPAKLASLIFKVIPDQAARVAQLQKGEVDLVAGLRPEDATAIAQQSPQIQIVSTSGRDYDFIGWNNIDPGTFASSEGKNIRPHKLFGSPGVRRALTMAINREELVQAYLGQHGQVAMGGISPLFKWAYNDTLRPLPFDPKQSLILLGQEGWRDSDGDGVLDKNGNKFAFTLKVPSGNQLRGVVASVIQQQLKDIKINMTVEQVERGTFWEDMMERKYDAWIAGFSAPLQMQLDDLWHSDLGTYPFNLAGFRNARVDDILATARTLARETDGAALWKEFQTIVHEEQPYTFLFWINNIVGVNTRVQGTDIGVLGTTHAAWNWHVEGQKPVALAR